MEETKSKSVSASVVCAGWLRMDDNATQYPFGWLAFCWVIAKGAPLHHSAAITRLICPVIASDRRLAGGARALD